MTAQCPVLTASNIKYLLALYALETGTRGVRCVEIAGILGITRPSVHAMVKTLSTMGLLRQDRYGTVHFTREGACLAARYARYYETVCGHLRALFINETDVKAAAYAVLAEIPADRLDAMDSMRVKPEREENRVPD